MIGNPPRVVTSLDQVRAALRGHEVGLVPTMGALHAGHLALIRQAAAENEITVVSVFVNPAQFNDPADLARYPRDLEGDLEQATGVGATLIYAPDVTTIYPSGFATSVEVAGLTKRWEGAIRPGHFRGVTTVVTILLNQVHPARAYFGEKDYQQLVTIRRLHADLALPGQIVACPTVRDADGLALSSRNARLHPAQRRAAAAIPRALRAMADLARGGETDPAALLASGQTELARIPDGEIEYLAVVNGETLEPLETVASNARALVAVRLGDIRLIDNVPLIAED